MKKFAILLVISLMPALLFAGGRKDAADATMSGDAMAPKDTTMSGDAMMSSDSTMTGDAMMSGDATPGMSLISPYPDFTDLMSAESLAKTGPTVLFFYATWCPTCQALKKELQARAGDLKGVNLIVVDYDNSDALKKKYGITYQHTFVRIDAEGMALTKWSGGDVDEILKNAKGGGMM